MEEKIADVVFWIFVVLAVVLGVIAIICDCGEEACIVAGIGSIIFGVGIGVVKVRLDR